MFHIFSDESWTADRDRDARGQFVFYGIMIHESQRHALLDEIAQFKMRRGLMIGEEPVEVKWLKVEKEWKQASRSGRANRYEEFLDIFFAALKSRRISFGCMFLEKSEYKRVAADFAVQQSDSKHNFLFMLYFQFLYHCFIKNQVKSQPCEIIIDGRDLGPEGSEYDLDKLRTIINRRAYRASYPQGQLQLPAKWRRIIQDSIQLVDLADSKDESLLRLADVCAGCIRYILEWNLQPPAPSNQLELFPSSTEGKHSITPVSGRESLATYFYRSLRAISRYRTIDLHNVSYSYSFNIFPFQFPDRNIGIEPGEA